MSTFENHLNPAISQNPHFSNAEESVARLWNLMKFYWNFISGIWTLWAQKCPSVPTSKAQTRTRLQLRRIATQCTLINSNISQIYSNMKININSYANPKSLEHESGLAIFMMFQLSQSKPKNVQNFPSPGGAEESSSVAWESRTSGAHYLGNCHQKRDPTISRHVEFTKLFFRTNFWIRWVAAPNGLPTMSKTLFCTVFNLIHQFYERSYWLEGVATPQMASKKVKWLGKRQKCFCALAKNM